MDLNVMLKVRNEALGMTATYSITAAGVEEFGLFPDCPQSLAPCPEPPITPSGKRLLNTFTDLDRPAVESAPPGRGTGKRPRTTPQPAPRKSRFTECQQRLRAMTIPDYAERHWSRESRGRGVEGSTSALANDLANHLRRSRGASRSSR